MAEYRVGDRVEIMKGKRQGQIAKVTELQENNRVRVQLDGLDYEVSYLRTDVEVRVKASKVSRVIDDGTMNCTPLEVHGDKKLRLTAYLVKSGKLCPSWPYSCTGSCAAAQEETEKARGHNQ